VGGSAGFTSVPGGLETAGTPPYSKAATSHTHEHEWNKLKRMALQRRIPDPHYM
jgi:hypothetical protein